MTIHCMACNGSIAGLGRQFRKVKASSNYGIASDGEIGCYVPEEYRSWCSSSSKNDNRAITIEVANDGGAPSWHVSMRAITALIRLLTDICRRNRIPSLVWCTDKADRLSHKGNMTVHRDFANKACPGDYLYNLHGYIAGEVNKNLGVTVSGRYVANGVDLSPVFDLGYYMARYPDVSRAYGTRAFDHFLTFGMNEARQGKEEFNPVVYKDRYIDLRNAFGDNWYSYYWHYSVAGKSENRLAI